MRPLSRPTIELHIDELVLDSVPAIDRDRVARAVERRLTQLFTERMVSEAATRSRNVEAVDGGDVTIEPGSSADAVGEQVGSAIFSGVTR